MATVSFNEMQHDKLAMSVAQALVLANEAAIANGTVPGESLVTISEEAAASGRIWRINYGPRNFSGRRGGDLIVVIDESKAVIQSVIRGQ